MCAIVSPTSGRAPDSRKLVALDLLGPKDVAEKFLAFRNKNCGLHDTLNKVGTIALDQLSTIYYVLAQFALASCSFLLLRSGFI